LPREHLECWRQFVLACRILCHQKLSHSQLDLADALLIKFCKTVESIYGTNVVTPNMHLHGHLKDVLLDYGPIQEFWLFSFERYNGILGKQPTNNREIESQLMQRFLRDRLVQSLSYPDEFKEDFLSVVEDAIMNRVVGSVLDTVSSEDFVLPTKFSRGVLTMGEIGFLEQLYSKVTNTPSSTCTVNSIFLKYSSLTINGKHFGSSGKRSKVPVVVLASWDESLYGSTPTPLPSSSLLPPTSILRPVNVHYFMKVSFSVCTSSSSFFVAHVSWFSPHPDRHALGKPVELWCPSLFESFGLQSFVPIKNISCRCAHGVKTWHDEQLLTVVPLIE